MSGKRVVVSGDLPEWNDSAEFVYYGLATGNVLRRFPCVRGDNGLWSPTEEIEYTPDWRTVFEINGVESVYQFTHLTQGNDREVPS